MAKSKNPKRSVTHKTKQRARRSVKRIRTKRATARRATSPVPLKQAVTESQGLKVQVGDVATDFQLPGSDGKEVALSDFRGKKVVLYFYPRDFTSGCTKEACSFRDGKGDLQSKGVVVLGISTDSVESHRKFIAAHGFNFLLLSDEKKEVVEKYGVWQQKSLYGRFFTGIVRTTFVIDERGIVTKVFPRVKVDGHLEEVLASL